MKGKLKENFTTSDFDMGKTCFSSLFHFYLGGKGPGKKVKLNEMKQTS